MTELFEKTRKFVEESFKGNKAELVHFDRTVYWLQQLRPDADEALLIAAIGHDIERAFKDKIDYVNPKRSFRDPEALSQHQNGGAEILGKFLKENNAKE